MILVVGNEKGGVSKTRVATHIAGWAATNQVDVVLLDTDRQGSAMSWSRIRNEEGLTPMVPVLALPPNPAREISNLSTKYDLVVVDIGAQNYKTMLECSLLSDMVIVPCGADQQEIESTLNVFDALKGIGPRHELGRIPAKVILTRVSTNPEARSIRDLRESFAAEGIEVFRSHLSHREAWKNTGKTGRLLCELKGKDRSEKAVEEMQALYDEILEAAQNAADSLPGAGAELPINSSSSHGADPS